jgi:hypothetical protein
LDEAINQAEDALEEAIANRIVANMDLPRLSTEPMFGQRMIPLSVAIASKAALYQAIKESKYVEGPIGCDPWDGRKRGSPIDRSSSSYKNYPHRIGAAKFPKAFIFGR